MPIDWFPLWLSLRVAAISTAIALGFGLWLAWLLANRNFGPAIMKTVHATGSAYLEIIDFIAAGTKGHRLVARGKSRTRSFPGVRAHSEDGESQSARNPLSWALILMPGFVRK